MRVLITGASSGIGRALALDYAAAGADVIALGRDTARLKAVAQACQAHGVEVQTFAVPVENAADMKKAILAAEAAGPLDIVIANAGFGGRQSLAGAMGESDDAAEALVEVNFRGVLNTIRPIIPAMVQRRRGRLGIVSSLAGLRGLPDSPIYSASKAAVRVYGEALRPLLRPMGISVSIILPGYVDTAMSRSLPFAKPMLIGAGAMARKIRRGIATGKIRITAPVPVGLAMQALALVPSALADPFLEHFRMFTDEDEH
jgi:short-subunit dehydrogenase